MSELTTPDLPPGFTWPRDPVLRRVAEVCERAGAIAEVLDDRLRVVFSTSASLVDRGETPVYGLTLFERAVDRPDVYGMQGEDAAQYLTAVGPYLRRVAEDAGLDLAATFGPAATAIAGMPAAESAVAWGTHFLGSDAFREFWGPAGAHVMYVRLEERGRFHGVMSIVTNGVDAPTANLLARGDPGMHRRMRLLREPQRRPSAILFADLEASTALSRSMSSKAYFELVRGLVDLIDGAVAGAGGITGKHAGDGASALFVAEQFDGGEPDAAAAAIRTAREIREHAADLVAGDDTVRINLGLHWGATLMVGQVATSGRLEVTALGDAMNEAARVESAASGGAILATKPILERLSPASAATLGIDTDAVTYRALGELEGISEKARRDASLIPVATI